MELPGSEDPLGDAKDRPFRVPRASRKDELACTRLRWLHRLERWQTTYLPVFALGAATVVAHPPTTVRLYLIASARAAPVKRRAPAGWPA
jgi:hypothetical protein